MNQRDGIVRRPAAALALLPALLWYGCGPDPDPSWNRTGTGDSRTIEPPPSVRTETLGPTHLPASTVVDARPMAIVNGQRVTWGDLRPIVTELAGGQGLEEVLLDRVVQAEAEAAAIRITPDDIAREQQLLLETLSTDPNRSLRLLDALRSRQRLGPERYDALLWRNAVLRALVKDDVALTEPQVRRMYDIVYGERRQARLIIVQTLRDAQSAREAIEGGRTFTDVAVERSTDSSAVRGGLLEPISEADPGYPAALRRALWSTEIGSVTDPILLDDQYAILRLEQILPPRQEPLEQVRPELERMTRLQQERIAMDRLARELILDVSVTIFDESLLDSWQRRRQATGGTP